LTDELDNSNDPTLGVAILNKNGKNAVTNVLRGSASWIGGINVNDELAAIDSIPVTDTTAMMAGRKPGDKILVTVNRDGLPLTLEVTLLRNSKVKYKFDDLPNPGPQQLAVRKKWLNL